MAPLALKIALILACASWLFAAAISLRRYLHILQLEDYSVQRLFLFLKKRPDLIHFSLWEIVGLFIVSFGAWWQTSIKNFGEPEGVIPASASLIMIVIGLATWAYSNIFIAYSNLKIQKSAKKALVFTARAKRIFYVAIFLLFVIVTIIGFEFTGIVQSADKDPSVQAVSFRAKPQHFFPDPYRFQQDSLFYEENFGVANGSESRTITLKKPYWFFSNSAHQNLFALLLIVGLAVMFLFEKGAFLFVSCAVWILISYEYYMKRYYITDAKRILSQYKPTVIGITGSYGKTGTKEILAAMLAEKYNVFRPPGSYNTLMGVTRVIRESLRPQHEYFIVEMGAYHEGSIQKMCDLVHPKHGLITIIGLQHLERFGSQRSIQRAKGELIRALPKDGIAILNGDDDLSREIGEKHYGKVIYFSMDEKRIDSNTLVARETKVSPKGSDFELIFPDGQSQQAHLSLLGRGAVANSLASAAMAYSLGVPERSIIQAMAHIPHVRHRLEPIKREGGITVIDDAFNSNPKGAEYALEVLSKATGGKRILVTPGMIELGEVEDVSNYTFGMQAAKACDVVVLVGNKRVEPIRRGLLDSGFNPENISVVESLNTGLKHLQSILQPGDTMLLENDLPDQYHGL